MLVQFRPPPPYPFVGNMEEKAAISDRPQAKSQARHLNRVNFSLQSRYKLTERIRHVYLQNMKKPMTNIAYSKNAPGSTSWKIARPSNKKVSAPGTLVCVCLNNGLSR